MKRIITTLMLTTSLAAGPAMAQQGDNLLSRENLGGVIGATLGGLAGNKIVDGDGQSAATAVGAVGGYVLGRNITRNYGRSYTTNERPVYSSQPRPVYSSQPRPVYSEPEPRYERPAPQPTRVNRIDGTFVANTTSNVRAGPSTGYAITDRLYEHQQVQVIGKVPQRNWYMVRIHGQRGFVYAPLLRQANASYRDYARYSDSDPQWHGRAGTAW